MNTSILVEFMAERYENSSILYEKLKSLGGDFVMICDECVMAPSVTELGFVEEWVKVSGMISSECASIIKLRDPFLAERMRISYISDDLKNKYRK